MAIQDIVTIPPSCSWMASDDRRDPTRLPGASRTIARSSGSGRMSICRSSRRDEELAALDPELSEALFGTPKLPFSVTLEFPVFAGPDYRARVAMARASRG